jgi:glycine oxidase
MLDVAVLGGGLIGCAVARELARDGRRVGLFERRRIGGEASGAAAGMLGVQGETDDELMLALGLESRRLFPQVLEALRDETGLAVEYWRAGTVYLCFNAADEAAIEARRGWQHAAGAEGERLNARQLRSLEPLASRRARSALLFPLDGRVDNAALTEAYGRAAAAAGCALHEGAEVRSIVVESGRVVGITTAAGRVACAAVVNAMGAWAGRIRGPTPLAIEPVRGQIAVLQAARAPFRHALYSAHGYAVPRRDGRVLIGSTRETVGFDKRVTAGGVAAILSAGMELSPVLRRLPVVATWAGLRPGSADGRPIIGADPAVEGYYVATGHYRNGVLLAPLTARLVAGLLRGQHSPWSVALGVERFAQ